MPYSKQTWADGPGGLTPLSAARMNYMEDGIEAAAATGGGGGTVVVYASDALAPSGDYQCDGTNDQVELLAAINAVNVMTNGGTVILSEGNFSFGSSLVLPANSSEVRIIGQGGGTYSSLYTTRISMAVASGTDPVIDARTNNVALQLSHVQVRQASTGASNIINLGTSGCHIVDCGFETETTATHRGIESNPASTSGSEIEVRRCVFYGGVRGACVWLNTPYFTVLDDNYFYTRNATSEYCVEINGFNADAGPYDETFFRITNNRSDGNSNGAVHITQFACTGIISGNEFWYDTAPAIHLEDCSGLTVTNNQIGDGTLTGGAIRLDTADDCVVSNNFIFRCNQHGIAMVDSDNNVVHGNMLVDCGRGTTNTYSGIFIDGDSDDNLVYGNKICKDAAAAVSQQLQYGIRIDDATCNTNMVYGNDVKGSYATSGISDAGTGTVTTSANRT